MIRNESLEKNGIRFVPGCMYRVNQDVEVEHLRGRPVIYVGYIRRMFDNVRAIICTLDHKEEWWILPHCLSEVSSQTSSPSSD